MVFWHLEPFECLALENYGYDEKNIGHERNLNFQVPCNQHRFGTFGGLPYNGIQIEYFNNAHFYHALRKKPNQRGKCQIST